jgi:hypothetical protein
MRFSFVEQVKPKIDFSHTCAHTADGYFNRFNTYVDSCSVKTYTTLLTRHNRNSSGVRHGDIGISHLVTSDTN